jgi:hypothetical protein
LFVSGHEGVAETSGDKFKLRVEIIGVFRLLNRVPFCGADDRSAHILYII